MATITMWCGGKFESDPIVRYVDGTCYTFSFQEEEFTVDNFKSKIHVLGYPKYKVRYVASIADLQNHIHQVDKMRDFKQLRQMALSKGFVNIFIQPKWKKLKQNETPKIGTPVPHSNRKQNNQSRRRKHVTTGPRRRSERLKHGTDNSMTNKNEEQSTYFGGNSRENDDKDQKPPNEANMIPLVVKSKCPSLSCDVGRFAKLIGKLSRDQRQWVKDMGFKHMLSIKITNIDPLFGVWVTSLFDASSKTLKMGDNISVPIDYEIVGWVLGVPAGSDLFHPEEASPKEYKEWKRKYKEEMIYGALAEESIYDMVLSEKSKKTKFQRHFLLYTLGVLLCPTQKCGCISPLHFYLLGNASKAYKYNWEKYVLDWLVKYREKFAAAKEGLGGCTLLLLVIYIDRIAHGRNIELNSTSSRIRYWNQIDVDYALKIDMRSIGSFGVAKAMDNVVYGEDYSTR